MPGSRSQSGTPAIDDWTGLKLLLDQNLSFRLLEDLEAVYPGSTQVKLAGLDESDDIAIWNYAKDNSGGERSLSAIPAQARLHQLLMPTPLSRR